MQDDPQKRDIVNRRHFSFRLNAYFFIIFLMFSVLIIRLAILQFVEGPDLKAQENNIGSQKVMIPPIRGNILDSTGYPIAYSTSTQSLYFKLDPDIRKNLKKGSTAKEQQVEIEERMRPFAEQLSAIFAEYGDPAKQMTADDVLRQLDLGFKKNTISTPRRIKTDLTNEEIAYFMENRDLYDGIDIVEESVRHYDNSSIAVQLVGYLKKFNSAVNSLDFYKDKKEDTTDAKLKYLDQEDVGMDGIELMYQDVLRGKNGLKIYPINALSKIIGPPTITNPEKGNDLYLTINKNVQLQTEQAITDHLAYLKTSPDILKVNQKPKTGYAVAMEVNTGKVVAMASMPDYNPNVWSGGSISQEDYDNSEYYLKNGTIREVLAPYEDEKEAGRHADSMVFLGSTQKPLSVLVGLNEQLFTTSTTYNDTGTFKFGRKGSEVTIRNASNHAYGTLDPAHAIGKSSNPFMAAMIGDKMYRKYTGLEGVDKWDAYMKEFGLGVKTGSDLPFENAGIIEYYHEAESASTQSALIRASFGQQARYTVLQLAQYAATLANRGHRMKPQFVEKIVDSDGHTVQTMQPEELNTVDFKDEYWAEVEQGMRLVNVSEAFSGVNYTYASKTGTSQQSVGGKLVDNAVFIAYAPAENPVLAVAVVVPEGGFGSKGAAPIARKIFDAYDDEIGLTGTPRKATSSNDATSGTTTGTQGTAAGDSAATDSATENVD
ncbi:penicillin-binding protein 2 [Paenibacillus cellulosilyticus]|uniref:Penicillin-binding protein 2 n=1 Tax=Paenibacillus cellulosilyticus TaxID=375489 RepID=A0A2V2Z1R2_9BACL|nr:penicillin-binding transpeptidase domain-containing protein [Paenibacillus cellulosilyticus]PWW07491.1 penicillin-binding protein 2 [Paenibacillus cellulosilyticus]QKS44355.1 penicillin-binding protein 2 [Paenibacillus cellulosilyticus]